MAFDAIDSSSVFFSTFFLFLVYGTSGNTCRLEAIMLPSSSGQYIFKDTLGSMNLKSLDIITSTIISIPATGGRGGRTGAWKATTGRNFRWYAAGKRLEIVCTTRSGFVNDHSTVIFAGFKI